MKINQAADEIIRNLEISGLTNREAIEAIGLSLSCMINHTFKDHESKTTSLNDLAIRIAETFFDKFQTDINGL